MASEDCKGIPHLLSSSCTRPDGTTRLSTVVEGHSPFWVGSTTETTNEGIGEREMKRAFEQIVNSIHMDEDEQQQHLPHHVSKVDRTLVPDLNNSPHSSSSRFSFTPQSASPHQGGYGLMTTPGGGASSTASPSQRLQRTPNLDPPIISSPAPLSTKSFLDDDWLRDRVKHDSKMAQVAGGLVRSSSTSPDSLDEQFLYGGRMGGLVPSSVVGCGAGGGGGGGLGLGSPFTGTFNSNFPPRDYVCKLCNVPGHWLKDCHLYEPRSSSSNGGQRPHHSGRIPSVSGLGGRTQLPPGNYVCRLCAVPGHWIEQCARFQPKQAGAAKDGILTGKPPKNYVCNLCHRPGHWIQQCSEFTPIPPPGQTKRSPSSERAGRFF